MPIYEYQCEKCQHHLEALQKISDKPLRECPECGRHSLKRLVSAPLFRLAGSGWYETDFKSEKETKRNLAGREDAPAEAAKDKAEGGKAETAAKPETKPATEAATSRKTVVPAPAARPKSKPKPSSKAAAARGKAAGKPGRKR